MSVIMMNGIYLLDRAPAIMLIFLQDIVSDISRRRKAEAGFFLGLCDKLHDIRNDLTPMSSALHDRGIIFHK